MRLLRMQDRLRLFSKALGLSALAGYLVWNAAWLARGEIPPSIFLYLTGWPCPTTGMTRSLLLLARGDVAGSLFQNPLTLGYLALLAVSLALVLRDAARRRPPALPPRLAWAWALALGAGWAVQIALAC